jgi:hypothetical protein
LQHSCPILSICVCTMSRSFCHPRLV